MSPKFESIKELLELVSTDLDKFENKHNKSAGVRARKNLNQIRKIAQEIRMDVLERTKNGKLNMK